VSLDQIYREYNQQVKFIKIYIREAHPVDGWWFGKGFMNVLLRMSRSKVSWSHYDPKTIQERRAAAADCLEALSFGVKTYVDEMDDRVNKAYAAWPTRLYLVDTNGVINYAGGLGPFGFKPAALKSAIQQLLTEDIER
jgi:hypothetical protein